MRQRPRQRSTSLLRLPTVHPVASLVALARCRWTARIAVWTARAPWLAYAAGPRALDPRTPLDRPRSSSGLLRRFRPSAPGTAASSPRLRAIVTAAREPPSSHGKSRQAVTDRQLGCRPCPPLGGLAFRSTREYQRRVSASVEDVAAVVRKPSTALPLGVKPHKYNDFGLMAMNDARRVTAASMRSVVKASKPWLASVY